MNKLKILIGAVTISAVATTSAFAGGMADEIMEAPVVVEEEMMAPAASSVSPTLIVVGILAALLLAASSSGDDGGDELIAISDSQLKENITHVGTSFSGLPIYTFNYIDQEGLYLGVMAQDVLMHTPEAAILMDNGYYAVDYSMLGMGMVRLN